jgi:manganese efflux pump family protein
MPACKTRSDNGRRADKLKKAYIFVLFTKANPRVLNIDPITIIFIALGLAMDALAVSIVKGMAIDHDRRKNALLVASFFGGFQMMMPVAGWYVGQSLSGLIAAIDHWIAFGLLAIIGGKMIYDSAKTEREKEEGVPLKLHTLVTLAIATSIDALMIGLSFAFLQTAILEPILTIGIITFSLSLLGFLFGCGLGQFFGNKVKAIGGLILLVIGIRILVEHLA